MMHMPTFQSARRAPVRWLRQAMLWQAMYGLIALAMLPAPWGEAQNLPGSQHGTTLQQPIGQSVTGSNDIPSSDPIENERLLRVLNADRQKSLVSDTNRLLRLVSELNAEVASSNADTLTPSQLHMMAEIERLAHNVKDKMSTSVRGTPAFQAPFQPVHR
jgi:hypothetical protein